MASPQLQRYLVELFLPVADTAQTLVSARRALNGPVRIVEIITVPEDETCFLVVSAPDGVDIATALQRDGLRVNRISAAATDA